jgi:threonine/homoserine efflux transporter RhtA
VQLTILAALYNATALGLLRYALICVALFPLSAQNRQLDEYIYYGRTLSKLLQLFYFSINTIIFVK